ncbi:aspartate--tRNA ligase, mitochondrial isoform X1 [Hetaerina americana]|uniref:aspartate--tRNA ligase, mitochondrial isoform X1 n=1 Tax=Hetaerina americana TaxID=62018 RepID=UPI003A7F447D
MGSVKALLCNCARSHFLGCFLWKECPRSSLFRRGKFMSNSTNKNTAKYSLHRVLSYSVRQYTVSSGVPEISHDCSHPITNSNSSPENKFVKMRTHTCGSLDEKNCGSVVRICGWLQFSRMSRFAILRDSYGLTQIIVPDERKDLAIKLSDTPLESVVAVEGRVILRPPGQENPALSTGKIEVLADNFTVLNLAERELPFSIRKHNKAKESLQLKHRYLSLRFPELQHNLRLRSHMVNLMREYLIKKCAFVEVETPTLFRRTPGGAQEYLVPTRQAGHFYSLVQSPQQLKQLLMVGAVDRYFQVARCYRDETARPDRQPEFTQLDIEMSFCTRDDVMDLVEEILGNSWHSCIGKSNFPPFPRITHDEAMASYGTDKPDTRFGMKLMDITGMLDCDSSLKITKIMKPRPSFSAVCFVVPKVLDNGCLSKTVLKKLEDEVRKTLLEIKSVNIVIERASSGTGLHELVKSLSVNSGDCIVTAVGEKHDILPFLGKLRLKVAEYLESKGNKVREEGFRFLWVEDFPLFFSVENEDGMEVLESAHHPFTHPHPDDLHLLETQPLKVRGLHYDLVCNGCEIGGGSVRVHDKELQCLILDKLGIEINSLSYLMEALGSGCPPHAGIALGLDRMMALAVGAQSVREVMAFPKGSEGQDIMSGSPSFLSQKELELYHISINMPKVKH